VVTEDSAKSNAQLELEKARAALSAARALAGLSLWDDAVSRAYYAAYHAATAALFSLGFEARTHAGTHDLFFKHLVAPGHLPRRVAKQLAALQTFREQADYSIAIRFDAESAGEEIEHAAFIVSEIEGLLRARGILS
jgi:uncharacterized protein (UPF0332 family)